MKKRFAAKYMIGAACGFVFMAGILTGCGNQAAAGKEQASADRSLYAQGMDLVALMDEMVGNDTYGNIFTTSGEIAEILDQLNEGDYTEPSVVYEVKFSKESKTSMLQSLAEEADLSSMSESLQKALEDKLAATVVSQFNGMCGVNKLAAASICTASKNFVYNGLKENVIYFYMFSDAQPIAVSFTAGENGAVSADSMFVMMDEMRNATKEEFAAYFDGMNAEISVVEAEK